VQQGRLWIESGVLAMALMVVALVGEFLIDRYHGRR